jgi:hypothetical protein
MLFESKSKQIGFSRYLKTNVKTTETNKTGRNPDPGEEIPTQGQVLRQARTS